MMRLMMLAAMIVVPVLIALEAIERYSVNLRT
jgi:hypothetical protein